MPDLKNNGDSTLHAYESLHAEAESLRQRVGQENVNQSSVLASRRLDEALLRLDLATGRRRDRNRSLTSGRVSIERETQATNHEAIQPRVTPPRTSDLELDESIQQSSAMWFESNDEERTKYRFDEPVSEIQPPASRSRSSATNDAPAPNNVSAETKPTVNLNLPETAPESPVSMLDANKPDSWAMLFASPIDVMISTLNEPPHEPPVEVTPAESKAAESKLPENDLLENKGQENDASETGATEAIGIKIDPTEMADQPEMIAAKAPPEKSSAMERKTFRSIPEESERVGEQASPAFELEPFQAIWQVDEFVVPSVVDELFLGGSIAEQLASRLAVARRDGLRTIAVTSTKSGEGRSTVAMGMALSVAFSGLKVAIVDADPKGVRLSTDLHLDLDHSWLDSVRQRLPLEEAAVHSDADSLTLMPLLNRDDEPAMDYTDLRLLLRKLKACFDLVVIDCGVSAFAEVGLCDTALIVRDVHRTKALEVETLARSLRRSGVQGVGVIENFCQG